MDFMHVSKLRFYYYYYILTFGREQRPHFSDRKYALGKVFNITQTMSPEQEATLEPFLAFKPSSSTCSETIYTLE